VSSKIFLLEARGFVRRLGRDGQLPHDHQDAAHNPTVEPTSATSAMETKGNLFMLPTLPL
jgi:hypothetical protein